MLGKRARAPMRRTTSMTGITVDVGAGNMAMDAPASLDPQNPITSGDHGVPEGHVMVGPSAYDHRLTAPMLLSPRYFRRDPSADHHQPLETANFLRTCGLCNRRLAPGRDIYMYRGDSAFCSQECREQRMKQDERKEKYRMAASKKVEGHHNQYSELANSASESSSNSETVAAA
ncbi:unnamed protein product [Coffea canephora]|uniref:FLZ-type domain-containing protein n=2 Tax=Coffea TaxID=13442 RepID=A0A068TZC4_COFCA|nr:FCS-Like Zinc finger 5-like [Coffea arabica]XP_027179402.1 FCS-Like Zinc finger 5-like [Coffea eugenioides]CDP01422.1 unnamed protein product [Coffea canephora]